ncbi:hypothetical protein AADZ90_005870 [Aestuariibius sp. 2305UL40-4]|uniref:hypothetical protein n=1 Tax=Aestuariibius violaceus TaxID=3234132 RepID=UPI00345E854F
MDQQIFLAVVVSACVVGIARIFGRMRGASGSPTRRAGGTHLTPPAAVLSRPRRARPNGKGDLSHIRNLDNLIEWLAEDRDQALWHDVVTSLNYELPSTFGAVAWILKQPDCQNAVAAAAMEMLGYDYYCGLARDPGIEDPAYGLIRTIAERDANEGFPTHKLADAPTFNRAGLLNACLEANMQLRAVGVEPIVCAPVSTLTVSPKGRRPAMNTLLDEDTFLGWA